MLDGVFGCLHRVWCWMVKKLCHSGKCCLLPKEVSSFYHFWMDCLRNDGLLEE